MKITEESLKALHDFPSDAGRVQKVMDAAVKDPRRLCRFLARYASWNAVFGSGVSALSAKIGRSRQLFLEPGFASQIADRSVLVASYFFDAARDEFDDRDTKHRDTHRCLAQASLWGCLDWAAEREGVSALRDTASVDRLLAEPLWLQALRPRVAIGYGQGAPDDRTSLFRAMGFHLGSEVLADQEFSTIDATLRSVRPGLIEHLSAKEVTIGGRAHNCYAWIRIHSGHGGGAEADHFAWAVRGADRAFLYTPEELHPELRHQLEQGYLEFVRDHQEFFGRVDQDALAE